MTDISMLVALTAVLFVPMLTLIVWSAYAEPGLYDTPPWWLLVFDVAVVGAFAALILKVWR